MKGFGHDFAYCHTAGNRMENARQKQKNRVAGGTVKSGTLKVSVSCDRQLCVLELSALVLRNFFYLDFLKFIFYSRP